MTGQAERIAAMAVSFAIDNEDPCIGPLLVVTFQPPGEQDCRLYLPQHKPWRHLHDHLEDLLPLERVNYETCDEIIHIWEDRLEAGKREA